MNEMVKVGGSLIRGQPKKTQSIVNRSGRKKGKSARTWNSSQNIWDNFMKSSKRGLSIKSLIAG